MKLGGWQRLWIVTVVITGIATSYSAFETRPKLSSIEREWIRDASDVIAETISAEENREITGYSVRDNLLKGKNNTEIIAWLNKVQSKPSERQRLFTNAVQEINEQFKRQVEELPSKQKEHFSTIAIWWFAVSILVYVLGWSIGWIARGFRSKEH